jgi:N-methylhydantoinase A
MFDIDDRRDVTVVRGDEVAVGEMIAGPAIIEEATTTVVLPPGTSATLSPSDSYLIEWEH